jgi:glycosyltransferase involved in cell wall biosynthesis
MKISIAVPSFNYSQYIEACLKSIKEQSYTDFEVLIADGGSNDGSLDTIRRYCAEDERFRLVSQVDSGQADAIKKAFKHASGEILCFLNADDCYLSKDTLTNVAESFTLYSDVALISFGGYYIDANGRWLKPIHYRYHPFDGFHLMPYRTAVLQPATFWKKEVYDETEWPVQFNFVFDVVFFYAAYQKFSWLELNKPIAGYRLHGDNKSMTVRYERVLELAAFERIKFGQTSFRAFYLNLIGTAVKFLNKMGVIGEKGAQVIYFLVNSLAYITCYRLPSI